MALTLVLRVPLKRRQRSRINNSWVPQVLIIEIQAVMPGLPLPLPSRESTNLGLMFLLLMRVLILICLVPILRSVIAAETTLAATLAGAGVGVLGEVAIWGTAAA